MCLKIRDIKEYILVLETWIVRFQIIISQEKINFERMIRLHESQNPMHNAQKSHDG